MADRDVDVPLAVALAEYEAVQEASRRVDDRSSNRFNYFIVVASGALALSAGLLGTSGASVATGLTVVSTVAIFVIAVGLAVFVRLVHYRVTFLEYRLAANALRTYLVRRAPELRPYVLLPTIEDDVPPWAGQVRTSRRLGSWASLSATIGLMSSLLVGVVVTSLLWRIGMSYAADLPLGLVACAASVAGHRRYERRIIEDSDRQMRQRAEQRLAHGD